MVYYYLRRKKCTVYYETRRRARYSNRDVRTHTCIQNTRYTPMYTHDIHIKRSRHISTCTEKKGMYHNNKEAHTHKIMTQRSIYIFIHDTETGSHAHTRRQRELKQRDIRIHDYTQDTFTSVLSPRAYKFSIKLCDTPGGNHVMQFLQIYLRALFTE